MVPHQDKSLDIKQRAQAHRLADLRRLIHDAEVKPAPCEDGVFGAHAGGGHHQLEGGGEREGIGCLFLDRNWDILSKNVGWFNFVFIPSKF